MRTMDHKRLLQGTLIILLLAAGVNVVACGGGARAALTPEATLNRAATPVPQIPIANQEARPPIDGNWEGVTLYRRRDMVTMVHFESREERIQGTLDFPQIGRIGLALSNVSFEPPKIHFELREFGTVFDGELNGDTISGEFVDPDGSGPFNLQRISP